MEGGYQVDENFVFTHDVGRGVRQLLRFVSQVVFELLVFERNYLALFLLRFGEVAFLLLFEFSLFLYAYLVCRLLLEKLNEAYEQIYEQNQQEGIGKNGGGPRIPPRPDLERNSRFGLCAVVCILCFVS